MRRAVRLQAALRCAAEPTQTRHCTAPSDHNAGEEELATGVPEAEYWKTAAHYYQERLLAQQQFTGQCARMSKGFEDASRGWEFWEIDHYTTPPAYDMFFENNSKGQRACVIDGLQPCPAEWAEHSHWEKEAGDVEVPLSVFNPAAQRGLQAMESAPLRKYLQQGARRVQYPEGSLDDWAMPTAASPGPLRSIEFDLPSAAPWMLDRFTVPRHFAQDLLQFAHQNTELRRTQVQHRDELEAASPRAALPALYLDDELHIVNPSPKVYIAPRGSQCSLHHAPFNHHTWRHVVRGAMEVIIFPADYAPCLYEEEFCTYALDAFDPDFETFPSAIMAYPWKVTLTEGQTLFVPADFPVQWRCVQDTISVSMNFVDWGNVETAVYDAERMADCGHPAFRELIKGFNMEFLSSTQCARTSDPIDCPYGAYLAWRNESSVASPDNAASA